MLISTGGFAKESAFVEINVSNISQISDGSAIIRYFSFNSMFHCDSILLVIHGPTTSKKSLFYAPGLHLDKDYLL